jgi:hypothetical protein
VIHYLRTPQQYDGAPVGTMVAANWGPATYVKTELGWSGGPVPRMPFLVTRRRVLRWGWG